MTNPPTPPAAAEEPVIITLIRSRVRAAESISLRYMVDEDIQILAAYDALAARMTEVAQVPALKTEVERLKVIAAEAGKVQIHHNQDACRVEVSLQITDIALMYARNAKEVFTEEILKALARFDEIRSELVQRRHG